MENQNQNLRSQLIERLKQANNVLVTVSRNPSVDQLSAAIGLTLMLNHLDKHATAVFSGEVPNTLEFLKPEETLERTTDSLRDFIISLDKSKADKLRYKVEDKMVKIFITPYRTSLTEADLVFGQGDFNVDVVVALGVQQKEDLDEAIVSHGRILHDATVVTVNTINSGQLGSINWVDTKASSLSEMIVPVCEALKANSLDAQMATAFLTGIVAETHRFSNEKTSSDTMNISAKLMAAGANQQLVATQLEQPAEASAPIQNLQDDQASQDIPGRDGSLAIDHNEQDETQNEGPDLPEIQPDHQPDPGQEEELDTNRPSRLVLEPPMLGGTLTANSKAEGLDPSTDPMTLPPVDSPLLSHTDDEQDRITPINPNDVPAPQPEPVTVEVPEAPEPEAPEPSLAPVVEPTPETPEPTQAAESTPTPEPQPLDDNQTLTDLESAVDSPHIADKLTEAYQTEQKEVAEVPDADAALAAAHEAFNAVPDETPEKPAAFNSTGLMDVAHEEPQTEQATEPQDHDESPVEPEPSPVTIDPSTGMLAYPTNLVPPSTELPSDPTAASVEDPTAPPTVPPPMTMPPLMPPAEPPIDPNNLPPVTP